MRNPKSQSPGNSYECSGHQMARCKALGWTPKRIFARLVQEVVASDLSKTRREAAGGKHTV
jgi:hypothetical protein